MPQASAPFSRRRRRIDRNDDAPQRRRLRHARGLDHCARPQRIGAILDDLAVDLLPAEPRAGIARDHRVEKRRRQVGGVGLRARARQRRARIRHQPLDQRDRPRRGGDHLARAVAEPQPELQHVEGLRRHGATWRARRTRRRRIAGRAGFPDLRPKKHEPPRRCSIRAGGATASRAGARRGDAAHQAGHALDHHLAHVVLGLADQRDAARGAQCKARRQAPARAPSRRRAASCRRRARRASATWSRRRRCWRRPAAPGGVRERDEIMVELPSCRRSAAVPASPPPAGLPGTPQCGAQARHGIIERWACRRPQVRWWGASPVAGAAGARRGLAARKARAGCGRRRADCAAGA